MSAGDYRFIRLRGGRSSADSARGTRPSGLPSIACGRDEGWICPFICAASASLSACEYNNIVLFLFSIYCVIRRCGHNWKFFTGCKNRKSLFFVDGMQTMRPLIRTARMFSPSHFTRRCQQNSFILCHYSSPPSSKFKYINAVSIVSSLTNPSPSNLCISKAVWKIPFVLSSSE